MSGFGPVKFREMHAAGLDPSIWVGSRSVRGRWFAEYAPISSFGRAPPVVCSSFLRTPSCLCIDRAIPAAGELWERLVPFAYSGTFLLSAALGIALPAICNRLYSKERAALRAAAEAGNLVELLMAESIRHHKVIEVSLKSCKVYIGYALDVEPPVRGESDVALIPLWSGYRNKDTCELAITTNYAPLIQSRLTASSALGDCRVVIPKSELISARFFDINLYKVDPRVHFRTRPTGV